MLILLPLLSFSSLIGFDIGTESIKAAVLRSGRSIEMVLNEQSKRKTPGMVSFESEFPISYENVRKIDRRVGVLALPVMQRNRSAVVRAFPEIIGKSHSPELQEHLDKRYLDFKMNGTLVNGLEPYVSLAMILEKFVKYAETQLQQGNIRDAVIAVPAYFTNTQRKQVARAAKFAGLHLLKIIDEKAALALVYAVEKTNFFTRQPRNVAIVDFGHGSLTISGFKFSAKIVTQKGKNPKPVPKVEELGYVWDNTVGGIDFDVAIAEYLKKKYNLPAVTTMLLDDAQKLKHALTLGEKANISIDSLDHRVIMTREEFQELCQPLLEKIKNLAHSMNMTFDSVEFVGGASRIPIIQDIMTSVLGSISRSLNSDEAVVMGAAYTAATESGAFKLMEINHDPGSAHSANLTYSKKAVRLFAPGSSLTKMKTARFDTSNETSVVLRYTSQIPLGCDDFIGEWTIKHDGDYPPISRIVLSYDFGPFSTVRLQKSLLFSKNENNEISQTPLDVRKEGKGNKANQDRKAELRKLIASFSANDVRLAKIAEARNTFESLVFELREAVTKDPVWEKVTANEEKQQIVKSVNEYVAWLDKHHEFDDETELNEKHKLLEESVKNVRYRVQESRTRDSSIKELEYLLNDMQDAVLNRWPAKKMKVPKQQKKATLNHVKLTREWLNRKIEEQSELEPWDDPILKTSDIELRIKKLGEAFRNLEEAVLNKKLRNRRTDDDDDDDNENGNDQFGADL